MTWLARSIVVASLLQVVVAQPKLVELCALNNHSSELYYRCPQWTASGDPAAITVLYLAQRGLRVLPDNFGQGMTNLETL